MRALIGRMEILPRRAPEHNRPRQLEHASSLTWYVVKHTLEVAGNATLCHGRPNE